MATIDPTIAKKAKIIAQSGLETVKYGSDASRKALASFSDSVGAIPIIGFATSLIILGWRAIDSYLEHKENLKKANEEQDQNLKRLTRAKTGAKTLYFSSLTTAAIIGFVIPPLGLGMLLATATLNLAYDATKLVSRIRAWNQTRKTYKEFQTKSPPDHPELIQARSEHKNNIRRVSDSAFKVVLNVAMAAAIVTAIVFPPLLFPMLMTAFAIATTGFIYGTVKAIKRFFRVRKEKQQAALQADSESDEAPAEIEANKDRVKQQEGKEISNEIKQSHSSEEKIYSALGIDTSHTPHADRIESIDGDEEDTSDSGTDIESDQVTEETKNNTRDDTDDDESMPEPHP